MRVRIGRVYFLSSILIAKLGCMFMSITIGPLSVNSFVFLHNCIYLIYNLSNFHTANSQALYFSLAMSVSELQSASGGRSNINGI